MFPAPRFLLVALLGFLATRAEAQRVHEIRLEGDPQGEEQYRFTPREVVARPGDVLLFRVVSGAPHGVVFEAAGLSAAARAALNAAMRGRAGDLSSPVLAPNARYQMVVPALPAGRYSFYCLPHRAYDERGDLTVTR